MPRAHILARCQFSLNQPRESPWTARSTTLRPPMQVSATERSFSNAMSAMWEKLLSKRLGNRGRPAVRFTGMRSYWPCAR